MSEDKLLRDTTKELRREFFTKHYSNRVWQLHNHFDNVLQAMYTFEDIDVPRVAGLDDRFCGNMLRSFLDGKVDELSNTIRELGYSLDARGINGQYRQSVGSVFGMLRQFQYAANGHEKSKSNKPCC